MAAFHIFENGVHLGRDLIEFHTASTSVQGGLEAETIELFSFIEILSGGCVVTLFCAAQAGPPLVASGVDRFGSALL
jgi:hypothetical protein